MSADERELFQVLVRSYGNVRILNSYTTLSTPSVKYKIFVCILHIRLWQETHKERDHYEDLDVGVTIILRWILERWDGMDWIDLSQDRDQWMALVNTVMNLRVP
jgi:hypothetical protein